MMKRFPDVLSKESSGNIYKLMQVIGEELDELNKANQDTKAVRDIDNAYAANLDNTGKNLNTTRNGLDDELYKLLLKLKVASKRGTDINTLIEIIATAMRTDIKDVYLKNERARYPEWGEPASLLLNLPEEQIESFDSDYLKSTQFLRSLVAGGVALKPLLINSVESSEKFDLATTNRILLNFWGNRTLYLDGTWSLDGSQKLDGLLDSNMGEYTTKVTNRITVEHNETCTPKLTVEKNYWALDGTYNLDGAKLLNAERYEEAI